jgi:hypothetical protein
MSKLVIKNIPQIVIQNKANTDAAYAAQFKPVQALPARDTKTISELPMELQAKMPAYVEKWTKVGLDTSKLDQDKVMDAVNLMYACGGKPLPKEIIIVASPASGIKYVNAYFYKKENPNATPEELKTWLKKNMTYTDCGYGQHDPGFVAFYDFMRTELGLVAETEQIQGLTQMCLEAGWFWAYDDVCFVSEKPVICSVDDNFRLHSEETHAIAYRDGFGLYAIHGVLVDQYVVRNPEKITVKDIDSESNEEVKRIKIDRFGVSRYLEKTGAKVVDMDMVKVNPIDSDSPSMPRALLESSDGNKHLVGTDGSTNRVYYMNVPREVMTCAEAHNSIAPVDENDIVASS